MPGQRLKVLCSQIDPALILIRRQDQAAVSQSPPVDTGVLKAVGVIEESNLVSGYREGSYRHPAGQLVVYAKDTFVQV